MIVDLFAGGGSGWSLAARALGMDCVGIEWGAPECATRAAAGLRTVRADVASYPAERFAGAEGLCASPPCQSFSAAGNRKGLADPRGQLVHEPLRWVRALRPRWVACEQVPDVLPIWRRVCHDLEELGYSVWSGLLDAADYGVPQIRRRAILLASLDRVVSPPEPTHSKTGHIEMFGPGRERWITMAEALGWGNAASWCWERPSTTVQGDLRIAAPGHHEHNRDETSIRVEPWELGVLQGFAPDHPWRPPYVARQIGNAIPPPLAEACLRVLI